MRIAIIDYRVEPTNPAGGCHWRMLRGLSREHQFTVFSVVFDNPDPERIEWVQIPVPLRPLALLFVAFHLVAPWYLRLYCWRTNTRFDRVQMVESNFRFADICYAHFCHRYYLKRVRRVVGGPLLHSIFRRLDHWLHASAEKTIFHRVPQFIVPSAGLKREIEREYPVTIGRIHVIHNPLELEAYDPPGDGERGRFRRALTLATGDCLLAFVALGHFERKGLPALLQAMAQVGESKLKLVVVGGSSNSLSTYRNLAAKLALGGRVTFVGVQHDIRRYLWASDAFILPSSYETFSLVTYEAAAAALPLLVARTSGIEDIVHDGENGIAIGTTAPEIVRGLQLFIQLTPDQRQRMGRLARAAVEGYSTDSFVSAWRAIYEPNTTTVPNPG